MARVAVFLLCGALCLGCAATDDPGSGFATPAERLRVSETTVPPPDPWLVDVATVRPEVDPVVAHRERPTGELGTPVEVSAEVSKNGPALTPIPSPELSWDSAAIVGGWAFDNPTRIGNPRVFVVLEDAGEWLRVMVPTRPNDEEGWIRADQVERSTHRWHVEIDVGENRLRVWEADELRLESPTVDGKPTTPTPLGRFYVNELQQQRPGSVYGPWIVSTDGFSDSLERFSGEVPIFAVHGTRDPSTVGTDLSNGCVRVPNEVVEQLVTMVPLGTPVDVVA